MKLFLLIHDEDTDTACRSDAKAFIDRQTARDAMQKEWNETVKSWMYDAKGRDIDADVFDRDVSDFPDEGEEDKAKSREKALNELINSPGWHRIW